MNMLAYVRITGHGPQHVILHVLGMHKLDLVDHFQFIQQPILLALNLLLIIILAENIFLYSLKGKYCRDSLKSSLSKFSEAVVIVGYRSEDFPHSPVYQLILAKMTYCYSRYLSNGTALSRLCFYEIMLGKTLFKV